MTVQFDELGLRPVLLQTLAELDYQNPTDIQAAMIPLLIQGGDAIGQAQTGTGKTAAYALPMLQNLEPGAGRVQGLVLAPTRELAIQVVQSFNSYGSKQGVRTLAVYGGQAYHHQLSSLRRGVDIVVGTPGRLQDLIKRKALDISRVSCVVLDEADEMLSMGFAEDIQAILEFTPDDRQTAFFSATLPANIKRLADKYMSKPHFCAIKRKQLTVAAIEQRHYLVNEPDKVDVLCGLFEVEDVTSTLVFARTKAATGQLANDLTRRGFPAEALNGDLSQDSRLRVLGRFRAKKVKILVATDVAARGLDIDDISHVINYDLPGDPEVFVHRTGRTGRAGKEGIAITLVTQREYWQLRRIEKYTKQNIPRCPLPSVQDIQQKRESRLQEHMMVWLKRGRCQREKEIAAELAAQGYDPLEVAAAAMHLVQKETYKKPISMPAEIKEQKPYQRQARPQGRRDSGRRVGYANRASHEKGMVRLSLSSGRVHGLTVSHVVGSLANHADIPGRAIGRISIQDNHTLVDVPESLVGQIMAKANNYRIGRNRVNLTRA
jgi:ATP-dependent RNA helicase DeaD